ncbi:hypothetical protein ACROYT_G001162 [Oculina patagonica]
MASFQKTFRKSGSHHAEFHSLQGVEVKIGEKFRPPKKVTLPVGWQQKDPSVALSLTYDFSLERDVISKADALRASKQDQSEASQTQPQVESSSAETLPNQNSIFSNVGSEILQPVVAPGTGHKKKDSFGGKGKNAFDLADFEGDTSTPFELVELQTINDLDELKNVLQPNSVPARTMENSTTSYEYAAHGAPSGSTGSVVSPNTSNVSQSGNSLIDISSPANVLEKPSSPISKLPDTRTPTNASTEGALLVDIGESRTTPLTPPATVTARNDSVASNSLPNTRSHPEDRPISRGGLLPPIGRSFPSSVSQQPQGQQPLEISTHSSESRNSYQGGIYSFPKTLPLQGQEQTTTPQEIKTQYGHYSTPPYVPSSREPQWNAPRSPEFQNTGGRFSAPLPPIGASSMERQTNHLTDVDRTYRSSLPDPWPVLDESEQSFVRNIASMGFPTPRVSRAVQRLGMKDGECFGYVEEPPKRVAKPPGEWKLVKSRSAAQALYLPSSHQYELPQWTTWTVSTSTGGLKKNVCV